MHFLCRSFIGPSSSSSWSQYWENEPDDLALSSSKGHLFGLITLSEGSSLPSLGRQTIEAITETYFSSTLPIEDSLKSATSSLPPSSQICLVVVCGSKVHLLAHNSTLIILKRGKEISRLLQSPSTTTLFLSGPILPQDRFFISTSEFVDFFTWPKIIRFLSETKVQTIEELILPQICTPSSSASLAASLIEVFADSPEEVKDTIITEEVKENVKEDIKEVTPPKQKFDPIFVSPQGTHQTTRRKKLNLIAGLAVIVLIATVSIIGFRKNRQSSIDSQYNLLKVSLEANLNNAQAVKNLDPASALDFVSRSRQTLDEMAKLKPNSEIDIYRQQLSSFSGKLGSTSDFNPELFYDTSLLASSPNFNYLFSLPSGLGVASISQNRLDLIDAENRSKTNLLNGPSLAGVNHFLADQKQVYGVFSETINKLENSSFAPVFSLDPSLGQLVSSQSWNHNLYFLTSASPYLYKLAPNSTGFGSPSPWASSAIPFTPVSLAIDGKIYLLGSDCRVRQYDRGQPTDLVSVPISNCQNPRQLSISSQGHLSFLNGPSELYHLDPQGQIAAVYKFQDKNFISAAIFADQIYFLASDQKIYRLPL